MRKHILVLDYGVGNIKSIMAAFKKFEDNVLLGSANKDFINAKALIIPGVGAFRHGMEKLKSNKLDTRIREFAQEKRPIMGICLGMQMLFSSSQEFGESAGLNLIEGDVKRLSPKQKHKLPNISWSEISYSSKSEPLLEGINQSDKFYHIHSFYAEPKSGEHILAKTKFFDKSYCSIAKKGNIFGCQFHPEKSGEQGLKIIKNFVDISNTNE
mgnify:FL=1